MIPGLVATAAQVLAAFFAILIARQRRTYLPAAIALSLAALMGIILGTVSLALQGLPVPYEGGARILFHIATASKLAGDAIIAGLAVAVAVAAERRRLAVGIVGGIWLVASVVIAALYPSPLVRGFGLARVHFASAVLGLCVATIAMVTRTRDAIAASRAARCLPRRVCRSTPRP
jgi:hypothetical protein